VTLNNNKRGSWIWVKGTSLPVNDKGQLVEPITDMFIYTAAGNFEDNTVPLADANKV
jgi:hypothetical protein